MSFPKTGKSFPKKGKTFPKRDGDVGSEDVDLDDRAFAMKIALALRSELKDQSSRVKLVAGWTGASRASSTASASPLVIRPSLPEPWMLAGSSLR